MVVAKCIAVVKRAFDAMDPFLESRKIEELLAKYGYAKEVACSYALPSLPLSLSLNNGPVRVCGHAFYRRGDDVVIVGDMRTLSTYPVGEETIFETACWQKDCPSRARVLFLPVARCTLHSADNKEMLAYLQGLISQQPSSRAPAGLS